MVKLKVAETRQDSKMKLKDDYFIDIKSKMENVKKAIYITKVRNILYLK